MKKEGNVKVKSKAVTVKEDFKLGDCHPDHDKHLCHIVNLRNMKTAAKLSKNAQYICIVCGRAAKNKTNLCGPVII